MKKPVVQAWCSFLAVLLCVGCIPVLTANVLLPDAGDIVYQEIAPMVCGSEVLNTVSGDSSPVMGWGIIAVLSAMVICGLIIAMKKHKK